MFKYITSLAFVLSTSLASASEMELPILGVVDGDTIRTFISLPCPLCRVSIRIANIDTPESGARAKCVKESQLATNATSATKLMVGDATVMNVKNMKWDKFGGRIVGEVRVNGTNIGEELIRKGVAVPYDGKEKRDWCS